MTDLRDRIAAAIYSTPPVWDQWPWGDLTDDARQPFLEQADAVIAALRELNDQCGDCWRRGDERDGCNCVYPKGHPSRD